MGKVTLGSSIQNIAAKAFAGCTRLYDVYCYATYPPFADATSFANYNAYLYVPCENQRGYILDIVWGKFKFIECLGADEVEDTESVDNKRDTGKNSTAGEKECENEDKIH